ncbi:hypothetical protein CKM354_001135600 [Cercospora kikuchii]|uniref:NB-ARC domain-containing protein n=1 Tax=Cercospora kikuchii TaxID=84275 RepID=A0A9P3FI02_9PEZI|nr:uncharacterized protein CKM354_001135600 [Cercospora kikuchii]GIZ48288.1 hypothetical protein CKM354_001135600 [Cercospora kikuchii]
MTTAGSSIAFGDANSGLQVGQSFAPISAEFHLAPERLETPPLPCSTVPLLRDPNYVSRKTLLDEVAKKASVPGARVAVVGLGGTGKTQLAVEYADSVHAQSPNTWIIWISAHNAACVQQSVKDVADRLKIRGRSDPSKDLLELLSQWLGDKSKGKWLAILDNLDDVDASASSRTNPGARRRLTDYFPVCDHGSVVVSTRSKTVAQQLVYDEFIIAVEPMDAQHANLLLEKRLGPHGRDDYDRLATALDFIPLAMSQAASYIRERGRRSSVEHYLHKIEINRQSRSELLRRDARLPDRDWEASASVITTWQISFEYISRERSSATELLSLMSMCDRQAIPERLLRPFKFRNGSTKNDRDSDNMSVADEGFEEDIAMLLGFSFISTTTSDTDWTMHRLAQDATQLWIEDKGRYDLVQGRFICNLSGVFPSGKYKTWQMCRSLLPHVQCALEQKSNSSRQVILQWAELMCRAGYYHFRIFDLDLAESMIARALRLVLENLESKDDHRTMRKQSLLVRVWQSQGKLKEAEEMSLDLLKRSSLKLGKKHYDTLAYQHNLAVTYRCLGRLKEAEALQLEVTELTAASQGVDDHGYLDSMHELALIYDRQGRFKESERILLQVLDKTESKLGQDHPDSLATMNVLLDQYKEQKQWQKAGDLNLKLVKSSIEALGWDHLETLEALESLADAYCQRRQFEDAVRAWSRVLQQRRAKQGPEHRDTLRVTGSLAVTYHCLHRWEEAEALLKQVLETKSVTLGADHPETLESIDVLATTYCQRKQWTKAEALLKELIEKKAAKQGIDHSTTMNSMDDLARMYVGQGQFGEATVIYQKLEKLQARAVETCREVNGTQHPETWQAVTNLMRIQIDRVETRLVARRRTNPTRQELNVIVRPEIQYANSEAVRQQHDDASTQSGTTPVTSDRYSRVSEEDVEIATHGSRRPFSLLFM